MTNSTHTLFLEDMRSFPINSRYYGSIQVAKGVAVASLPLTIALASLYSKPLLSGILLTPIIHEVDLVKHYVNDMAQKLLKCLQLNMVFYKRLLVHFYKNTYYTYPNPAAEARYWRQAAATRKQLSYSDARWSKRDSPDQVNSRGEQQVLYYVPRLLPEYREPRSRNMDASEYRLPSQIFIDWYSLMFPGQASSTSLLLSASLTL